MREIVCFSSRFLLNFFIVLLGYVSGRRASPRRDVLLLCYVTALFSRANATADATSTSAAALMLLPPPLCAFLRPTAEFHSNAGNRRLRDDGPSNSQGGRHGGCTGSQTVTRARGSVW